MADFHVAHKMHTYTIIPRVLYVRRWGLKRWSLAFGKSGRVTYGQTQSELRSTVLGLKGISLGGATLSYAKELVLNSGQAINPDCVDEKKAVNA
ncbi:MAG: hypothetical protein Q9212_001749 [Teloschistes hypoglaucus]